MAPLQFGAPIKRTEDSALLRGRGQFVDDIHLPGMLHAAFVRSTHAHASIRAIDLAAAAAAPGVTAIFTAADMPPRMRDKRMPMALPNPALSELLTQFCLARDEVCHVGEAIAVVIAENRYRAEDAAALVAVDYESLPAVSDCRAALAPGAPPSHLGLAENCATLSLGYGDVDAAFAAAAHVFGESLWQHRGGGHAMECRAVLAAPNPVEDRLTVWSSTQTPHIGQAMLARLLERQAQSIRVVAPDVGGGFGPKQIFYAEEAVIAAAALKLGRPVKWIEDRREHFLTATQERDQYWEVEVALDPAGRLLGVRGSMAHDSGAYVPWGMVMPFIAAATMPGPYVLPAYRLDVKVCFTNTVATAPVRGAGRPQAVFAMERLMDRAARELGIDRAELRRRNFIQPEQMPYRVGMTFRDGKPLIYDSGDYPATQAKALSLAGYAGFAERQAQALAAGRYIGIGLANYVEGTGLGPFEGATVRVREDGKIAVNSGAASQGQGHKTALAQICADLLGVALEDVVVSVGDSAAMSMGVGAFASRLAVNAGSSAHLAATALRRRVLQLAARVLEADEAELSLGDGRVEVTSGNRRSVALADLAALALGSPGSSLPPGQVPGLEHTAYFTPDQATYSNGAHVVEVEVDIDTGGVRLLNYAVAHDSGNLINPLIVEGQIQGGLAHGIGNALYEWMIYDDGAQPMTTSFGDYLLPIATDVPGAAIAHLTSPSPLNPLGVKGAGEGGTIPAAAAIIAAVEDALKPFAIRIARTPLTPDHLAHLLRERGAGAARDAGAKGAPAPSAAATSGAAHPGSPR